MDGFYCVERSGPGELRICPQSEASGDVIVRGEYRPTLDTVGWDILKLETDSRFDDADQAFAAGYFEGYATAHRILPHAQNTLYFQPVLPEVAASLRDSMDWLDANLAGLATQDPYWEQVNLLWTYFNGMHAGINAAGETFSRYQLFQLAALADIQSIQDALKAEKETEAAWVKMDQAEFRHWFHHATHCSALFKLTHGNQEIFAGHCTWIFWPWMARVFKHITLNYNTPSTRARTVSYSSWAGAMSSMDDYYQTSAGLTVLETSISVFRNALWVDAQVGRSPDKLLYWMRAMVAHRMADSGPGWVDVFSQNNGGTYNNEWYVLDRNRFVPGQALQAGLLTVANQLPTMIRSQDMTGALSTGYVPSYNVPAIQEVFDVAGYPDAVAKQGGLALSYFDCARAQIFRRDQDTVTDMASMKHMMQYNDYENDPISQGDPMNAIASRGDLKSHKPTAFGAIDAKISTVALADLGITEAFSGPTPQQGPFSFDAPGVNVGPHDGVPTNPVFDWQSMGPMSKA